MGFIGDPPHLLQYENILCMYVCMWKFRSVVSNSVTPWTIQVHVILQVRILVWVAFPFSRVSSQPRDRTQVTCIAGRFFTNWATREAREHFTCFYSWICHKLCSMCGGLQMLLWLIISPRWRSFQRSLACTSTETNWTGYQHLIFIP